MDLDAVATELYGLVPAEFTNARDARASEAKRAGGRELAKAIGKLRRPSVGAWLANALVRERPYEVQSMLDLGEALRQAQAHLAKEELRKLQKQRRSAVAALLGDAAALARDRGETISISVTRDLEATLEAALLDPEAASALKAGVLTTGLRYAGLGWPAAADDPSPSEGTSEPPSQGTSEQATIVGRAEVSGPGLPQGDQALLSTAEAERGAEAQLAEAQLAEAELAETERRADAAKRRLDEAERDRDMRRRKVADLERQLDDARAEAQKAERRVADAEEDLGIATQRLSPSRLRRYAATPLRPIKRVLD
ncbi:MAG: hypothetical protein ABSA91_14395 [Acidimicrobiales bacterium]|jgi:hypothetical protein